MTLPFNLEDIIKLVGIHPLKVRNVYLYGSRVYSTHTETSDYDIICIAGNLVEHEEKRLNFNGVQLNIHVITPDKFLADLARPNIMNLECVFAPEFAVLQEKLTFSKDINTKKLIKNILAQSYDSWRGAKMKMQSYDIYRAQKSMFHSLRMLMFAIQIAEHGKIVDFAEANNLKNAICECDEIEWDYYKGEYLPLKIKLEDKLKSFGEEPKVD